MSKLATLFGGKPKIAAPTPLPEVVKRDDPEIEKARKRSLVAAKQRTGRRALILTGGSGLQDQLSGSPQSTRLG